MKRLKHKIIQSRFFVIHVNIIFLNVSKKKNFLFIKLFVFLPSKKGCNVAEVELHAKSRASAGKKLNFHKFMFCDFIK